VKLLTAALAIISSLPLFAAEEPLSDVDRQLLLEKLKTIEDSSNKTVTGRLSTALTAFRAARESDASAHDLYLKCIEKIRFEEQAKKSSEFRDWKKRHKERADSPGFRLALRHQLNWLVLSLEASRSEDVAAMAPKGIQVIENILADAEKLRPYADTLKASVLNSIFAQAYKVGDLKTNGWPKSPLAISALYTGVIFPPLQEAKDATLLRKAWLKRITHEGLLLEKWTEEGSADKDRKPAFDKWFAGERKNLVWNMEVDLFNIGAQRASALRMLEFIKQNLDHKSAPGWIKEFTTLVEGSPPEEEETEKQ